MWIQLLKRLQMTKYKKFYLPLGPTDNLQETERIREHVKLYYRIKSVKIKSRETQQDKPPNYLINKLQGKKRKKNRWRRNF